jgi:3-hydroxyacyl-CoA dehydrogenase/3-hydroxy-2-methylbutyryl-CoA dehydrogenase
METPKKSALVAGGASGLGAATARALHAAGAEVTIADRDQERGEQLAAELGDGARFAQMDVTEPTQVESAVQQAAALEGGLRIAVNCAGIGWAERTASKHGAHSLQPFETVINVNLLGTFNVLRFASAAMVENEPEGPDGERGVIVNTASIAAYDGQIGQLAYAASKGGVVAMTLPAARDLARHNIRVNTIAPGLFDTPLLASLPQEAREALGATIPYPPRLGNPAEYGQLALAIIANPMLNGETIRLDGAIRMAPK